MMQKGFLEFQEMLFSTSRKPKKRKRLNCAEDSEIARRARQGVIFEESAFAPPYHHGKGGGKGKRSKSEPRPEKRKQQRIPFLRGICKKGDQCMYEHQVDDEGKPIPVGPEIIQKYDEAVERFNDNRAQAKAKSAPKEGVGVTASMIVLEPEEEGDKVTVDSVKAPVSDEYYAMVVSGTNVIVPLRPGEIAECKAPSRPVLQVEGPFAQVLKHGSDKRLVVAFTVRNSYFSGVAHHCRLDIHSSTQGQRE